MKTIKKLLFILAFLPLNLAWAQTPITATLPYAGGTASGDYTISSNTASTLSQVDKPIIVLEGFDPTNSFSGADLMFSLNNIGNNNLVTQLRNLGYDFIVLNYADGGTYMQRNAFLLQTLISNVNSSKTGNEKIIVLGISMGGLVARYALAHMEHNNVPHNVSTYISYDTPHKGANIPVALQWLVKHSYFAPYHESKINALGFNSPAVMQMLKHFSNGSSFVGSSSLFTAFFNELASFSNNSFPNNLRKIAISNGSKNPLIINGNQQYDIPFSYHAFVTVLGITMPTYLGNCRTLLKNYDNSPNVVHGGDFNMIVGNTYFIPPISVQDGIDNAPGGFNQPFQQVRDGFFGLLQDIEVDGTFPNNCFVPTVSALALNNTTDWYYDTKNDKEILCHTPFDAIYAPQENLAHASSNNIISNWLFDQIINNSTTWQINPSTSFTYGYNFGGNTNDIVNRNININSGAKLGINCNQRVDDVAKNSLYGTVLLTLPPPANSTFQLNTDGCKSAVTITINSGARLDLGDGLNRKGVLCVNNNSILNVKGGGNLQVNNNCTVIIESGGKLVFEKGAQINLVGTNSILIVKAGGKIQIGQDAVFTYTGEGFIRLETAFPSANALEAIGSNAQFKIVGSALGITSKKVLEITGNGIVSDVNNVAPAFNLAGFSIQNAHIALAANANLNIGGINTKCDFRFMDIRAIVPNDINNRHRGITVNGQYGNMFYKVNINDAKTGITSRNFYGGGDIDILQVNATRCGTAVYVQGAGARIQDVNINACDVGIWLVGMNRSTRLNNPVLFNNKTSVYAFNCASNVVEVYMPYIHSSIYGLVADNSRFSVMCGIVKNNSSSVYSISTGYQGANVYLKNNANFIADPVMRAGSGKTDMGNWRSKSIQQQTAAYGPYLRQGSNSLFTDLDYSIYGTLTSLTSPSRTYAPVIANNNLWRGTTLGVPSPPINWVDYLTKYTNNPGSGAPLLELTYSDLQPLSAFTSCSAGGGGGGSGDRMRGTIIDIVTPIKDLPNKPLPDGTDLKNKIQEGYQYFFDMVPNHALAVSNLTYALNNYNYNPSNFTSDDLNEWSIALMEVNTQLIEALSEGLAEENITKYNGENTNYSELVQGVISLQDKLLVDFTEDALNTFTISMNKAALLRMLDDRAGAIQTVSAISAALYPELNEVKESFLCMTTKEQNLIDGSITQEQFNAIECSNENFASLPDPFIDTELVAGESERNIAGKGGNQSIINPITVYPNPSKGVFGLKFKGEEATFYEIEVFDILGAKVASQNGMNLRENNVELNLSTLPSGTYFLRFVSNKEVQLKKLVITK